ncbi:hypothetical protein HZH68_001485 [Vespula germanica]|uniref:Uncharacterized protein n=1 Tax=Vespula germanica TaxID=30212 RepID=A0A834U6Z8_VESGE|nr:hypothetical protein HZH68_001485 [Vespula germanica]
MRLCTQEGTLVKERSAAYEEEEPSILRMTHDENGTKSIDSGHEFPPPLFTSRSSHRFLLRAFNDFAFSSNKRKWDKKEEKSCVRRKIFSANVRKRCLWRSQSKPKHPGVAGVTIVRIKGNSRWVHTGPSLYEIEILAAGQTSIQPAAALAVAAAAAAAAVAAVVAAELERSSSVPRHPKPPISKDSLRP